MSPPSLGFLVGEPETHKTGRLHVSVHSDSQFFLSNVPIEIRDSDLMLVERVTGSKELELPVGLYQVSAVLNDGVASSKLVRVLGGKKAEVELSTMSAHNRPVDSNDLYRSVESNLTLGGTRKGLPVGPSDRTSASSPMEARARAGAARPFEVDNDDFPITIDATDGKLRRLSRTSWVFEPQAEAKRVPIARVRHKNLLVTCSLPASRESAHSVNTCEIHLVDSPCGLRVRGWISPERTVARALQNMLDSGEFAPAAAMAKDGAEALQYKYSDPTGAALGSLILNKFGHLGDRKEWLENLARGFSWLPDAKVLLALAILQAGGDSARALDLAIHASRTTLLYTEVFSLLLDMLRRWPDDLRSDERIAALGDLGELSPFLDWNSICLSRVVEE